MNYKEDANKFLEKQLLMHLATSDADTPWVCAVEFVHDEEFNLYWRSDSTALHTKNLLSKAECAVAITALFPDNRGEGIQARGMASPVSDGEAIKSLKAKIDTKRNKKVSNEISEKEDVRGYWKFSPTTLFYINEPVLGYERIEIELLK